jgi:hypothetical protein
VDVSQHELADRLTPLLERLAENAHDIWARARLDTGWKFGPARDEILKLHPCLVPYADLTEVEKDVDRQMVEGTLRAIRCLGYDIVPAD